MPKSLLLALIMACTGTTFAQSGSTLFEIGAPLTTPDANYKNLVSNFPKYVSNAKAFTFVNFRLVDTVRDQIDMLRYLDTMYRSNADLTLLQAGNQRSFSSNPKAAAALPDVNTLVDVLHSIQKGYLVYALHFAFEGRYRVTYLFINPADNKVVTKGNVLAFPIAANETALN